jgi:hypothetical protein
VHAGLPGEEAEKTFSIKKTKKMHNKITPRESAKIRNSFFVFIIQSILIICANHPIIKLDKHAPEKVPSDTSIFTS